jgi:heme ABC exporter ATP-binding subunit CcmA
MPAPDTRAAQSPRISLQNLSKFFGRFIALDRLTLSFQPGEFVVVLGRNGAGKTTLLRTLALLLQPSEGELLFDAQPVSRLPHSFKQRLGFVGHEIALYDDLTAEENLRFFARLYGITEGERRAAEVLAELDLTPRAGSRVRSLSRGLKQRLALARAWLHQPDVLLLDEPATGLDAPTRERMHDWLARCHSSGRTVVASSHDLTESLRPASRVLLLESGRVLFDGPNAPGLGDELRGKLLAAAREGAR